MQSTDINTVRVQELALSYWQSAAFMSAIDLEVFTAVDDVAIMASNLPQYSPELIAHVVCRTRDALVPGGQMHLIGETLDDDGDGPISPALWGLSEALSSSTGVAHSEGDCVKYFTDAGFTNVTVSPFIEGTLTRITGARPPQ